MDEVPNTHPGVATLQATAFRVWQKTRQRAARVPITAWVMLVLFTVAATLMGLHLFLADKTSSLHLKVQHSFRSARIAVWVDGEIAYSGKLTGSMKKRLGLIPDSVQGTLSQNLPLTSGKHLIRVQVTSDDGVARDDTISGDFSRNSERTLSVSARRAGIALSWQGATGVTSETVTAAGWLERYASTLFLTIAGSIMSALAGFAVRELPKQIGSRQGEAPKI
ncbi:MAG: hypothetical protein DMG73_06905 [Acidobacteria bacterium]|nr:MAG: hypothetical protein DMG73_06905 [Acidobacteriota bacterium]PYX63493.1 MAG: hypothetical protein DMG74_16670 [Acidobacteriota bacterium]